MAWPPATYEVLSRKRVWMGRGGGGGEGVIHLYFTFVCQFSADTITKAFIAKANMASLLITRHSKE